MSARALNGHALVFEAPVMTGDEHELFTRHLLVSAQHFEGDARQLTAQIRPALAVVRGLAETVAGTAAGTRSRPMFIKLSADDALLVRAFLDRSLQRAADEAADGGRPGHTMTRPAGACSRCWTSSSR